VFQVWPFIRRSWSRNVSRYARKLSIFSRCRQIRARVGRGHATQMDGTLPRPHKLPAPKRFEAQLTRVTVTRSLVEPSWLEVTALRDLKGHNGNIMPLFNGLETRYPILFVKANREIELFSGKFQEASEIKSTLSLANNKIDVRCTWLIISFSWFKSVRLWRD